MSRGTQLETGARRMTEANLEKYIRIAGLIHSPILRYVIYGPGFTPDIEKMVKIIRNALPVLSVLIRSTRWEQEKDAESAGGRWYRRVGNTMYSYLSEYYLDKPNGSDIESDTRNCSAFYNKLRFTISGDIYSLPSEKPFLDNSGAPTDDGNYSHRPNPAWFYEKVDLAVQCAYEGDMINLEIFRNVDHDFRLLKESRKAYELGTAGPRRNILAKLPEGKWDIFLYDMIAKSSRELGTNVSGEFTFNLPESRA